MFEAQSAAEAVQNGALMLDEKSPGWWQKINLEALDLTSCESCVCGQVARYEYDGVPDVWRRYDNYVRFLSGAAGTWSGSDFETANGFFAPETGDGEAWNWDNLDREWGALILARQTGQSKPRKELALA